MLSSPEEAHLEGAKNLWRYNRGDLFNVAVYVGVAIALFGACWLVAHLLFLLPYSNPIPHHYGHLQPVHGFPRYHRVYP